MVEEDTQKTEEETSEDKPQVIFLSNEGSDDDPKIRKAMLYGDID